MQIQLTIERLEGRDLPSVAFQNLPILPFSDAAVLDHARAIFEHGQQLGRRSDVFLKLGDSNTAGPPGGEVTYLAPLGAAGYNAYTSGLAATHPELLNTLEAFRDPLGSPSVNSFNRDGPGAHAGWLTGNVLSALPSEIAATDAGVALIMIGTNNVGNQPDSTAFRADLTSIIHELIASGIVPIVSTIPDMSGALSYLQGKLDTFNQVVADIAAENRVPVWNVSAALKPLPAEGIGSDGVHLNAAPDGGGSFYPADMQYGQNVRNLEALQILDWFRSSVAAGPTLIAPNPTWQAMPTSSNLYAVGLAVGFSPTVDVYDAGTGALVNRFLAFGSGFGGGVRVATGDVNGDGFTDVICATGAGTAGCVKVFSGKDGSVMARFTPFAGYSGGLAVAVGDLNSDGVADVVVGRASGSGVRVYDGGTFALAASFKAFPGSASGVSLAVANVAGLGQVIAAASSTNPTVRLFDASGSLLSSFQAFNGSGFGITIAAADLDGDGSDELAVARTTDSNRVRILNASTHAAVATFTVGPVADASFGIRLGTLRASSGNDTLLVGNGPGSAVSLASFDDLSGTAAALPPTNAARAYGIFVG